MPNPISTLRDDFADNVQADAWSESFVAGSATKAETSGQARLTLPSSVAGSHLAAYQTGGRYDLTGDGCFINIDTMVATGVAATAFFQLFTSDGNVVQWTQTSNTLKAQKIIAGVTTDLYSATWSSSTYKYLRIRESGGNLLFDSSTNGTSWTNRHTTSGLPIAVTEIGIAIGASCGNIASPGSFRIEEFNTILPALSTNWHMTQVEWPLLYRFRSISIAATSGQGYIATSNDGTTWAYYSGPIGSASGGYNSLTAQSTQAAAQAMAVNLTSDGRWDLPSIVECRFIKLYHRSITGSSYTLREYYPRRLVQSDDIEAESIRAINIAANTITAEKITAIFTITGKTIQTAESGLRVVLSGDNITTYNASNAQQIVADGNGILLVDSTTTNPNLRLGSRASLTPYGALSGHTATNIYDTTLTAFNGRAFANDMRLELTVHAHSTAFNPVLELTEYAGGAVITLLSIAESTGDMTANGDISLAGGLNIGTGTSAGVGQIAASSSGAFGANVSSNVRLYAKGADTGTSNYAMVADDSAVVNLFRIRNDGQAYIKAAAWIYGSDRRLKKNIRPIGRGLADLRQLIPRKFDSETGAADQLGFIADEVQVIMPELVVPIDSADPPMLGLYTTNLIPVLVEAVKELAVRVTALEGRP